MFFLGQKVQQCVSLLNQGNQEGSPEKEIDAGGFRSVSEIAVAISM